jgi:hypothetical protein
MIFLACPWTARAALRRNINLWIRICFEILHCKIYKSLTNPIGDQDKVFVYNIQAVFRCI